MQLLVGPYALSGINKIVSGRSLMAGSLRSPEADRNGERGAYPDADRHDGYG
jgi:hypothetical protein